MYNCRMYNVRHGIAEFRQLTDWNAIRHLTKPRYPRCEAKPAAIPTLETLNPRPNIHNRTSCRHTSSVHLFKYRYPQYSSSYLFIHSYLFILSLPSIGSGWVGNRIKACAVRWKLACHLHARHCWSGDSMHGQRGKEKFARRDCDIPKHACP